MLNISAGFTMILYVVWGYTMKVAILEVFALLHYTSSASCHLLLWRFITNVDSTNNLDVCYQQLVSCVIDWMSDACSKMFVYIIVTIKSLYNYYMQATHFTHTWWRPRGRKVVYCAIWFCLYDITTPYLKLEPATFIFQNNCLLTY